MKRSINFEEWLPWEQNASPMLLVLTLNAGMRDLRKYFGMPLWTSVIIFEDNQAKWLFRPKELKLLGQKMIDFLLCPPFRVAFFTGYDTAEETLLKEARQIQFSVDLQTLSNDALAGLFENFSDTYYAWYKYGWFCEPIQFQAQDILNNFLEKEAKKGQAELDVKDARAVLFSLEEESFAVAILDDLRECASALGRVVINDRLASAIRDIRETPGFAEEAARIVIAAAQSEGNDDLKMLVEKLRQHSNSFYWKKNNYFSTRFLTAEDVLIEIFSQEDFDLLDPTAKLNQELTQIRENKRKLISKKQGFAAILPPYFRNIVALVGSVGGSLLDRRKKTIMIANSAFDRILAEVAMRTSADIGDVRLLIPQELRYFLSSPREYHERFASRRNQFLVFQGDVPLVDELIGEVLAREAVGSELRFDKILMNEPFVAEGEQAEGVIDQLNSRLNFLKQQEALSFDRVQGVTAYFDPGEPVVEGVVTVIRDPKAETLSPGDILVAPSTTPDYMEAIRRCKAIVTDWGGQTSHAAIASRELRKPCIIGTNYGSQVLRNRDRVRLDLRHGIVEVIEQV